jgi:hypothetical protein
MVGEGHVPLQGGGGIYKDRQWPNWAFGSQSSTFPVHIDCYALGAWHIVIITPHKRSVVSLAITIPYSQGPGGGAPVDGVLPLAYNGNMVGYSQYFPCPFLGLAGEARGRIISL